MPPRCVYCACTEQTLMLQTSIKTLTVQTDRQLQHVTLHRQTHHTEGVSSSGGRSQTGRSWASDIPHCPSSCGRNQHSGPLWLICRTLLLSHPAEAFFLSQGKSRSTVNAMVLMSILQRESFNVSSPGEIFNLFVCLFCFRRISLAPANGANGN